MKIMLEIEKSFFKIKFSEMNIRQRMYQGKSIVTVQIMTEFYPSFTKDKIISGAIEIKLDAEDIHSIDDLNEKHYNGDIGNVTISIYNEGIWEHKDISSFSLSFQKRSGREIPFLLETEICKIDTSATVVSLYTTSTDFSTLKKNFRMIDFYDKCIQRKIGNSMVSKYYIKN